MYIYIDRWIDIDKDIDINIYIYISGVYPVLNGQTLPIADTNAVFFFIHSGLGPSSIFEAEVSISMHPVCNVNTRLAVV